MHFGIYKVREVASQPCQPWPVKTNEQPQVATRFPIGSGPSRQVHGFNPIQTLIQRHLILFLWLAVLPATAHHGAAPESTAEVMPPESARKMIQLH